jgi:hypothetical protein
MSIVANFTSASGCEDHTTSPSARRAVRLSARLASTASRTNVRDDRDTPLFLGCGTVADIVLFWVKREAENFFERDWTGRIALMSQAIFRFWRMHVFRRREERGRCDAHYLSIVVPAHAGIHSHRPESLHESRRTASLKTEDTAYGSRIALASDNAARCRALACPGRPAIHVFVSRTKKPRHGCPARGRA